MSSHPVVPVPGPWNPEEKRLLEEAKRVRPLSSDRRRLVWEELDAATRGPRRRGAIRIAWGLAGAAAAAALVALAASQRLSPSAAPWPSMDLGAAGSLEVAPGAVLKFAELTGPVEQRIDLEAGSIRMHARPQSPRRPVVVKTPHLRVIVVGTRFQVDVGAGRTRVRVDEGRVRVEARSGASLVLSAGASAGSDDPRLQPAPEVALPEAEAPSAAPAPAAGDCAGSAAGADRRSCLERLAAGEGLAAQNALYALGLMAQSEGEGERALEGFRRYQARFQSGALGPEAALGALRQLLSERRWREALEEAESFRRRFPEDGRAAEVALVRANLLCRLEPDGAAAGPAYSEALDLGGGPTVRDDALYGRAVCLQARSSRAQARAAWERYLAELPNGAHAREARRWLEAAP